MAVQRRGRLGFIALAIAALMGTFVAAQGLGGAPPPYDKKTEATLEGSILEVKPVQTLNGVEGTHLMLDDGKQPVEVFAGPTPFVKHLGATFTKGERIKVIGSLMQIKGVQALLAQKITTGGKTFEFRDENGNPLWLLGW